MLDGADIELFWQDICMCISAVSDILCLGNNQELALNEYELQVDRKGEQLARGD